MTGLQVPQIEPVHEKGWRKRDLDQLHTEFGFHVVPTGPNKLPLVKWRHGGTDYVEVKPTDVEVRRWVRCEQSADRNLYMTQARDPSVATHSGYVGPTGHWTVTSDGISLTRATLLPMCDLGSSAQSPRQVPSW